MRLPLHDEPKRELWYAWYAAVFFYSLYSVIFFLVTHVQPPGQPWYSKAQVVHWFAQYHDGLLIGFALIFTLGGLSATSIALITWICTGGTPISMTFLPKTMSAGVTGAVGNPKSAIASSTRCPFSSVGRTRMSRSPVKRGAP